jgi:hypothetical protein
MHLSKGQKYAVHAAARAAQYDDARYRQVLKRLAGVRSCTDPRLTRENFIRVMAFFEAECAGRLPGFSPGYWSGQDLRTDPGDSLRFACRREAAALGWTDEDLDSFLGSDRCSSGHCLRLDGASNYWLSRLLDALKAIRGRHGRALESRAAIEAQDAKPAARSPCAAQAAARTAFNAEGAENAENTEAKTEDAEVPF